MAPQRVFSNLCNYDEFFCTFLILKKWQEKNSSIKNHKLTSSQSKYQHNLKKNSTLQNNKFHGIFHLCACTLQFTDNNTKQREKIK